MPRCVLLVEDTADLREMWRLLLDSSGFEVVEAVNGVEAVALTRERHPDVVVMDLSMPVMDGLEAIRLLKRDTATADVPIIALTAQVNAETAAREAGCDEFRQKPVRVEEFLSVIRSVVGKE